VVFHFHEGRHYHISLCRRADLGEGGVEAYQRIRRRYDNQLGTLSVSITNSAANLTSASDLSRLLLDDPDIALLHGNGCYANRPLHVSL
jgi:hypothetical protein